MAKKSSVKKSRALSPSVKALMLEAIKHLEGPDMDYYACNACMERYQHASTCVVMKMHKRIAIK